MDIERISDCILRLNIAKSGFYNFESDAFNHSATLPAVDFIRHLVVFAKANLTFVACIHANELSQTKNVAKVIGSEFILLRPDRHILRLPPY